MILVCMNYKPVIVTRPLKHDNISWATKEEIIEIRADSTLEIEFHEKELTEFRLRLQQD